MNAARPLLLCAAAYFAIGCASAVITNPITAQGLQAALRVTALVLAAAVFVGHVRHETVRLRRSPRQAAMRVAGASALGGLLLAIYALANQVFVRSRPASSMALVLLVWPLVSGALGFCAAFVLARLMSGWRRRPPR